MYAERIKTLMEYKGIKTFRELAEKIGQNEYTIGRQLKGDRGVSLDVITNLLMAFPDISAEWLMRGEGDVFKSELPEQPKREKPFYEVIFDNLCNQPVDTLEDVRSVFETVLRIRKRGE